MSNSRTLCRKLDLDLIARIEASGRPEKPKRPAKRKTPRAADSYRGAIRNERRVFRAAQLAAKRIVRVKVVAQ